MIPVQLELLLLSVPASPCTAFSINPPAFWVHYSLSLPNLCQHFPSYLCALPHAVPTKTVGPLRSQSTPRRLHVQYQTNPLNQLLGKNEVSNLLLPHMKYEKRVKRVYFKLQMAPSRLKDLGLAQVHSGKSWKQYKYVRPFISVSHCSKLILPCIS